MNKCYQLSIWVGFERVCNFIGVNGFAPVVHDHDGGSTTAFDVFFHAPTEYPVLAHDDFITRLDQIDETGFHARRTGGGNRHG